MDSSQAPLISNSRHDDDAPYDAADDEPASRAAAGKASSERPGLFVLILTFAADDTGVISATLVSIGKALSGRDLTSMDKSIITSSTSLFALLVSPFSSHIADRLGRKRVILYADVLFIVGAALQAVSSTVPLMVAGRCIIGAAVGAASFVVPLYIAEVAPSSHRGRLVTINVLFITLGQMAAYILGWALSTYASKETGWRWMVGLGALPAGLQGALVALMPETPRWLVKAGRSDDARRVIQRVDGVQGRFDGSADAVIREIEMEVREEEEARLLAARHASGPWKGLGVWHELLSVGKHRRALAIACLLQGLQQLCGFNSLMYFSATIFSIMGFESPTLTSLIVAITNFVFTLVALVLIDRIGRRRILLYSIPFMALGLLLAAAGFSHLSLEPSPAARNGDDDEATTSTTTTTTATTTEAERETRPAVVVLVSIMVYVASYALGLGNVPWMQSELFPLAVRSAGSGAATATNWAANFAVGLTFLPLMDALSPSWTFVLYAAVCAVGYVLVWRIYPETAGLSLEEATALLDDGWGVR
ncbi:general substrate transporter [Trichoderma citrinoviride]|uniref:General substrate transporter n=1 Tax=Trichoderma citrinoviride TaxID=58853 RepID=A0A2T4BEM6_9HYPO|nr:general substrate transporter [Trichoderma citrinoviride]PTB67790.1 general substrate transporter [Trichoderma citrinoviride]